MRERGGQAVTAYGSRGLRAEAQVRYEGEALTVLRVAAGGEVGRHPADVDQFLLVVAGRGSVQSGDGPWEPVEAGHLVMWRAGEVHTTRADDEMTAYVLEAPGLMP